MADWGTANARALPGTITRKTPGTFTPGADPTFNLGSFQARDLAGGGSSTIYIDRVIPIDAEPAVEGVGDWGIRVFSGELGPMESSPGGGTFVPILYSVPADSTLYIRELEVYNSTGVERAGTIWFAGFPVFDEAVEAGDRWFTPGTWILGEGELVEGVIEDSVDGVYARIVGVLEVRA